MLGERRGNRLYDYVPDYVVFDLETTGTSANADSVIEISAVKVKGGEVIDEFSTLVNPERSIPYYASQVNGITDEMVEDAPTFDAVLADFIDFVGNEVLVGHNIHTFDMKFLYRDAEKYWGKTITNDYIDTLTMARQRLQELDHHRLVDLAEHYGISSDGAHRALNDCRMNQQVFEHLNTELYAPSIKEFKMCPNCGLTLRKRTGRFGEFWGCSGYPECKYTEDV